ncbi:hypothetical protein PAMC26577_29120 [Caballeronia sordidicola]|uniref:Uncharacterized protein n=1 Tax=Caballeronia sordidicola TaxID=196367 RepID=A0A242MF60_CABSO|nr:hypothetical protein PAMC26577_29120 [Caballeronia sordidicola]
MNDGLMTLAGWPNGCAAGMHCMQANARVVQAHPPAVSQAKSPVSRNAARTTS